MDLTPFGRLPPFQPRQFIPADFSCTDWKQIAPWFAALERRGAQAKTPHELEAVLRAWSELSAALDEEGARRYIAMTCHTDHPEAEQRYLHFVEQIEPHLKARQFQFERACVQHPQRRHLPASRYAVLLRDLQNRVALFREENVALETEETRLGQQYQKLSGSLTVSFRGAEHTLVAMGKFLEEPDRPLRQQAWELVAQRRLAEAGTFESQLDRLVELRQQIAHNAGFANYRDYAFRARGRFDYTPQHCFDFHEAVARTVVPLLRELQAQRRQQLGLATLRPWDLAVDPLQRPPLKPFSSVEELVARTQQIFDRLDPHLAAGFQELRSAGLLDLANRKGKAPGGYQSTLNEARLPFIFMNAVGQKRDVEVLLHEAGHAFHALATRSEDLLPYRSAPIEFCEVASMSMELLGNECIDVFYQGEAIRRARIEHLESIISVLGWVATVDAFQHWLYTHPGHTRGRRGAAWNELMDRFGGDVDWNGWTAARTHLWHRQLHIFLHPFYYIEYGIAQLGALQVWANARRDRPQALRAYRAALGLGGSRPLPELFAAAGCRFQFDAPVLEPLMNLVRDELAKLRN